MDVPAKLRSLPLPAQLLVANIHGLNYVNLDHGHLAGDRVLHAVEERVGQHPDVTAVARVSSNDFALAWPAVADIGEPEMIRTAEMLLGWLSGPVDGQDGTVPVRLKGATGIVRSAADLESWFRDETAVLPHPAPGAGAYVGTHPRWFWFIPREAGQIRLIAAADR